MRTEKLKCSHCGEECGHEVKVYKRSFYRNMVLALECLEAKGGYAHTNEYPLYRDCFSKLRLWNMAQDDPIRNGYWRITKTGRDFLAGKVRAAKALWVAGKNNEVRGFADDTLVSRDDIWNGYEGPHRATELVKAR